MNYAQASDKPTSRRADKAQLRRRYLAQRARAAAAAASGPAAADLAMGHFLAAIELAPNAVVAAYWPMRNELDPRPLMTALGARGCRCALPVIVAPEAPLMFRSWRPGDALDVGLFDTRQPTPEAAALEPDVVIAPLVAFDESGHRLGYGGGYYDRTLEKLRRGAGALAVGYAYAGQLVAALPQGPFDQKLDWLVSDKGVRAFV